MDDQIFQTIVDKSDIKLLAPEGDPSVDYFYDDIHAPGIRFDPDVVQPKERLGSSNSSNKVSASNTGFLIERYHSHLTENEERKEEMELPKFQQPQFDTVKPDLNPQFFKDKTKNAPKFENKNSVEQQKEIIEQRLIKILDKQFSTIKQLEIISKNVGNTKDEEQVIENIMDDNQEEKIQCMSLQTFDPGAFNQHENKEVFVSNYGIQKENPFSFYIMDIQIYPKNLDYVVQVYKWVIANPEEKSLSQFRNYNLDGTSETMSPEEYGRRMNMLTERPSESQDIGKMQHNQVFIRLMKKIGNSLKTINDYAIPIYDQIDGYKDVEITFSDDGKFMAVFRRNYKFIRIFNIENGDLPNVLQKIQDKKYYIQFKDNGLENFKDMKFDNSRDNCRRFCFWTETRLTVIQLDNPKFDAQQQNEMQQKDIQHQKDINHDFKGAPFFKAIISVNLLGDTSNKVTCYCSCQYQNDTKVAFVDLFSETDGPLDLSLKITFQKQTDRIIARISNDFKMMMLSNGEECYILRQKPIVDDDNEQKGYFSRSGNSYIQKFVKSQQNKNISEIIRVKDDFLVVSHTKYDVNVDCNLLLDELKSNKNVQFPRIIQPNKFKILDVRQECLDDQGFGKRMVIVSLIDEILFYDEINCQNGEIISQINLQPMGKEVTQWPYVAMAGNFNSILLFNAFDENFFIRIPFQDHQKEFTVLERLYITPEYMMYALMENYKEQKYEVWYVDLDFPNTETDFSKKRLQVKKLFEYEKKQVGDNPKDQMIIDFFIRPESDPTSEIKNKKLFVFILHPTGLIKWTNDNSDSKNNMQLICRPTIINNLSCIKRISQEEFIVRQDIDDGLGNAQFSLRLYKAMFSNCFDETIFTEKDTTEKIQSYCLDIDASILILIFRMNTSKEQYRFKIQDYKQKKTLSSFVVTDDDIIGRIQSQQFELLNGYFYFNNQIIKLRYDLFRQGQTKSWSEEEVFDRYTNILNLEPGEEIISRCPLICQDSNRMVFVTRNPIQSKLKKIIILPFLHKRKIYLGKNKNGLSYFQTAIEAPVNISDDSGTKQSKYMVQQLVSLDITNSKYCIYSEGGILKNRINFKNQITKYGKIISVSNNGRLFITQDPSDQHIVHILGLLHTGMKHTKTIDIKQNIKQFLETHERQDKQKIEDFITQNQLNYSFCINNQMDVTIQISGQSQRNLFKKIENMFPQQNFQFIAKVISIDVQIEQGYVTDIQEIQKLKFEKKKFLDLSSKEAVNKYKEFTNQDIKKRLDDVVSMIQDSLFYIERGAFKENQVFERTPSASKFKKGQVQIQSIFQQSDSEVNSLNKKIFFNTEEEELFQFNDFGKFIMNNVRVFFYSHTSIWYLELDDAGSKIQFKDTKIRIDQGVKNIFIKRIVSGRSDDQISIILGFNESNDQLIQWDVKNSHEITSNYMGLRNKIFHDSDGGVYLRRDNNMIQNCNQKVILCCYDVPPMTQKDDPIFQYEKGYKCDYKYHNWVFLDDSLSLSFSYMTLVIREFDFQKQTSNVYDKNYHQDTEMFNFIINKRTFLTTNENFVSQNHEKLDQILGALQKENIILLSQLNYYYINDKETKSQTENQAFKSDSLDDKHNEFTNSFRSELSSKSYIEGPREVKKGQLASLSQSFMTAIGNGPDKKKQQKITPLLLSLSNQRSVTVILKYLKACPMRNVELYIEIFPELLEISNFVDYLDSNMFKTSTMELKYTLVIEDQQTDRIAAQNITQIKYQNEKYFQEQFEEDKTNDSFKTFPVELKGIEFSWINSSLGHAYLNAIFNSENIEIYGSEVNYMIIEYLYKYHRQQVVLYSTPELFVEIFLYFLVVVSLEIQDNETTAQILSVTKWLQIALGLITMYEAVKRFFTNLFNPKVKTIDQVLIFTILYSIGILAVGTLLIIDDTTVLKNDSEKDEFIKLLRQLNAAIAFILLLQISYLAQLYPNLAPLVNTVYQILSEIVVFTSMLILCIIAFSVSFYLLGKNQNQFDSVRPNDPLKLPIGENQNCVDKIPNDPGKPFFCKPMYSSFRGSLETTWLITLGDFSQTGSFQQGQATQQVYLQILFIIASFFLCLHFMNMIIAIMNGINEDNNEIKDKLNSKSHLRFILDTWWQDPLGKEYKKIYPRYLITAFLKEDQDQHHEKMNELKQAIRYQDQTVDKELENIQQSLQKLDTTLEIIKLRKQIIIDELE